MDEWGIPGGLFTVFFLWGLWEWSKKMKRDNGVNKTNFWDIVQPTEELVSNFFVDCKSNE